MKRFLGKGRDPTGKDGESKGQGEESDGLLIVGRFLGGAKRTHKGRTREIRFRTPTGMRRGCREKMDRKRRSPLELDNEYWEGPGRSREAERELVI